MTWQARRKPCKKKTMKNSPYETVSQLQEQYNVIAGLDEAGWGPLAGPFVAATVSLATDQEVPDLITDSKKLTVKKRDQAYEWVMDNALEIHLHVTAASMFETEGAGPIRERAFATLLEDTQLADVIVIDGSYQPKNVLKNTMTMVKADLYCAAVSAASIVAKVERDRMMLSLAQDFPEFEWHKNKGYATKAHIEAIAEYGITTHHRRNISSIKNSTHFYRRQVD